MSLAELLSDKLFNQRTPLRGAEFPWQRHFDFPIGCAVGAFVLVRRLPEVRGVVRRPGRHIPMGGRFQILIAAAPLIRARARDIGGMYGGFAFAAHAHGAMIRGHEGLFPRTVSRRSRETTRIA